MNNLEEALQLYRQIAVFYVSKKTVDNYCTFIRTLQKNYSGVLIDDLILPFINHPNPIQCIILRFNSLFTAKQIGKYSKNDCQSALISFAKFILGQYDANLYLGLERTNDKENCMIVAKNALFCTIDIAEQVKIGQLGSRDNMRIINSRKGNDYYSWFRCKYQRANASQIVGGTIPSKAIDPLGAGVIKLDSNNQANLAIKYAVIAGLPNWLQKSYRIFNDYMACHIWDKTCYDYLYHTSVFNLVLLPKSIGGLTDYNEAVKKLLQYEAAMRFGMYPKTEKTPALPDYYNDVKWRQPDEHLRLKGQTNPI